MDGPVRVHCDRHRPEAKSDVVDGRHACFAGLVVRIDDAQDARARGIAGMGEERHEMGVGVHQYRGAPSPQVRRMQIQRVGVQRIAAQVHVVAAAVGADGTFAKPLVGGQRLDVDDGVVVQPEPLQPGEARQRRDVGDLVAVEAQVRQTLQVTKGGNVGQVVVGQEECPQTREAGLRERRDVRNAVGAEIERRQEAETRDRGQAAHGVAGEGERAKVDRVFQAVQVGDASGVEVQIRKRGQLPLGDRSLFRIRFACRGPSRCRLRRQRFRQSRAQLSVRYLHQRIGLFRESDVDALGRPWPVGAHHAQLEDMHLPVGQSVDGSLRGAAVVDGRPVAEVRRLADAVAILVAVHMAARWPRPTQLDEPVARDRGEVRRLQRHSVRVDVDSSIPQQLHLLGLGSAGDGVPLQIDVVVASRQAVVRHQRRDVGDAVVGQVRLAERRHPAQRRDIGDGVGVQAQVDQGTQLAKAGHVLDRIGAEVQMGQRPEPRQGGDVGDRIGAEPQLGQGRELR